MRQHQGGALSEHKVRVAEPQAEFRIIEKNIRWKILFFIHLLIIKFFSEDIFITNIYNIFYVRNYIPNLL